MLLNLYVRPPQPVMSYLTPLTGLSRELLESQGMPLEGALALVRRFLPRSAVLVGQNISKDVQWLGLRCAGALGLSQGHRAIRHIYVRTWRGWLTPVHSCTQS